MSEELEFKKNRISGLEELYSDEQSARRWGDRTTGYSASTYSDATSVRQALEDALTGPATVAETSKKLYATNPIYASVIDYLANLYMWRYKVTPHQTLTGTTKKVTTKGADFGTMYSLMLEVVDGMAVETKFPSLLTLLLTSGAVYITTIVNEESYTLDSIILPNQYCRKVGDTQYGTAVISFDFSYFQNIGYQGKELDKFIKQFPPEFKKGYNRYLKNATLRWQILDPRFSTGVLINDAAIPTIFYLYGSLLNYQQYQSNELERNNNKLKYLVIQKMPIFQDKLVLEVDEAKSLHRTLAKVVNTSEKARLITTYGDISIEQIGEKETTENVTLKNAFKTIFNDAGLNNTLFTSDSVETLLQSIRKDQSVMWKYIQQFVNFYNVAINNWFDFKGYEAIFEILPVSLYNYKDDIEVYKTNATLGVGKLDYLIVSGIKQKNVTDQLNLEAFLNLNQITPMQTSYTQTAVDRAADGDDNGAGVTGIEPSDNTDVQRG